MSGAGRWGRGRGLWERLGAGRGWRRREVRSVLPSRGALEVPGSRDPSSSSPRGHSASLRDTAVGWGPSRPRREWGPRQVPGFLVPTPVLPGPQTTRGPRRPGSACQRHEAAPRPAAPGPGDRLGPSGRQQDPQPVSGAPGPSRHAGPPWQPGPAGPRRPRRPRWRARGSGRERRGREAR